MIRVWLGLLLLAFGAGAYAQFPLEDFALTQCGRAEPLFRSGLEGDEAAGVRASGGKAGTQVGAVSFAFTVPDTGRTHTVLLQVPAGYDDRQAWPMVVALHGAAASPSSAAAAIRTLWQPTADLEGALVLAPIASGNSGGWAPDFDTPALACALAEVERRYDVDRARRYLWGFSAGAHYGHALALANSTRFAAYAVNAGALYAFACGQPASAYPCEGSLPTVARRIPVQLRVGTNDTLEPYTDGDALRLEAAGWSVGSTLKTTKFVGGHTVGAADPGWAWSWFEGRALPF
jgi:poly(3-hydroxybutyrate) depolymerase